MPERAWAMELARRNPFGILVTCEDGKPYASHLPMLLVERDGALYALGHVARANRHARSIAESAYATAMFSGAHAFVSASWYEAPYETVPTWNYTALHVSGTLAVADARDVLERIVARFEGTLPGAWRLDGLDDRYLEGQLRGIVAFALRVEQIDAKAKLSQNRTPEDRQRVERALSESSDPIARACAEDMRELG